MSISTTWVFAEAADGKPLPVTLELLTKARELGGTIEAWTWGPDTAAVAPVLGAHGATKVHDLGDIGGALPGVPVAAAMADAIATAAPDLILFGMTYDGRDTAGRLLGKLPRTG